MLVGEAPGQTDIDKQEGFTGSSGRIMNKILGAAVLSRDECSLNYVVKELVSGNDFWGLYEDKARTIPTPKLSSYIDQLKDEISAYRPNLAVAVGEEALRALTGLRGITKYRGSVLGSTLVPGLKVIPTVQPAWILQGQFKYFWITVADFQRAAREYVRPELDVAVFNSITNPTPQDVLQFFRSLSPDEPWCIDIETRAQHIACFSVAQGETALCVPLQNTTGCNYGVLAESSIWLELQHLMNRCPKLVGQNLTFDLDYLLDRGICPSGIWMDTMVAHSTLYPEFPKGLDFLASFYTKMPYYKDEGKTWNSKVPDRQLWEYNNKDTITTLWAQREIDKQLTQRGLFDFYHGYVNEELWLALEMQRLRLPVDESKHQELKVIITEELQRVKDNWALEGLAA
jgi:uracil-DNA glycosylase family 4